MKMIFRYEIDPDSNIVEMPKDAEIISAVFWKGCVCVWAIVEADNDSMAGLIMVKRRILLCGTGHTLRDDISYATYIGTVVLVPDKLIVHVFDYGEVE